MIFPSGPIGLFARFFKANDWTVIGAVSPEVRSKALLEVLKSGGIISDPKLVSIQPEMISHAWSTEYQVRLRVAEESARLDGMQFTPISLMASTQSLVEIFDEALGSSSTDSLLIDISSLPKRFFFPLLKRLIRQDSKFKNIVVAYTGAKSYPSGKLSDATDPITPIPLFQGNFEDESSQLYISAGFEPHSLPEFSRTFKLKGNVHVLFPFPPGPPHFFKSHDFVRMIEKAELGDLGQKSVVVKEIDAMDLGGHLEYLYQATNDGKHLATFAPFGPKSVSLAMALHALAFGSKVVYSQPRIYNPEYSSGVSQVHGHDNIQVYGLKLNGKVRVNQWQLALEGL